MAPVPSKAFFDIQPTIECRFTLNCLCDMITKYSQMHCTDKYSQHSEIIWPVWQSGLSVRLRTKWLWVQIPLLSLRSSIHYIFFSVKNVRW